MRGHLSTARSSSKSLSISRWAGNIELERVKRDEVLRRRGPKRRRSVRVSQQPCNRDRGRVVARSFACDSTPPRRRRPVLPQGCTTRDGAHARPVAALPSAVLREPAAGEGAVRLNPMPRARTPRAALLASRSSSGRFCAHLAARGSEPLEPPTSTLLPPSARSFLDREPRSADRLGAVRPDPLLSEIELTVSTLMRSMLPSLAPDPLGTVRGGSGAHRLKVSSSGRSGPALRGLVRGHCR